MRAMQIELEGGVVWPMMFPSIAVMVTLVVLPTWFFYVGCWLLSFSSLQFGMIISAFHLNDNTQLAVKAAEEYWIVKAFGGCAQLFIMSISENPTLLLWERAWLEVPNLNCCSYEKLAFNARFLHTVGPNTVINYHAHMYAFNRRRDLDIISESYKIQEFDLTTWIPDPSPNVQVRSNQLPYSVS